MELLIHRHHFSKIHHVLWLAEMLVSTEICSLTFPEVNMCRKRFKKAEC